MCVVSEATIEGIRSELASIEKRREFADFELPETPPPPTLSTEDVAWRKMRERLTRDRAFECKKRAFAAVMTPETLDRLGSPYQPRTGRAATAGPSRKGKQRPATVLGRLVPREHPRLAFGQKKVHLPKDEDVKPPRMRDNPASQRAFVHTALDIASIRRRKAEKLGTTLRHNAERKKLAQAAQEFNRTHGGATKLLHKVSTHAHNGSGVHERLYEGWLLSAVQ